MTRKEKWISPKKTNLYENNSITQSSQNNTLRWNQKHIMSSKIMIEQKKEGACVRTYTSLDDFL